MHTITLELLRHGPAHNQLLSPLTPYLALCENHGAVTLHVPFEHNQLLHRLDALNYLGDDAVRIFQLKDTAAELSKVLGLIPGLTAEANKQDLLAEPLTHLRLIISASELALLPFELALAPAGLPGAGQHLLLQPQMPICLTREVRRAPDDDLKWSEDAPRILFIAAAPPEVGNIPVEAHLLALRRAIDPWMEYYDPNDANARAEAIKKHFVFLPNASIETIERECASSHFSHIHILAHGRQYREGYDTRYALALHDASDPDRTDRISGARLATALRASNQCSLARPTVVTLASCHSANVGSVAGAGASIAHALHEAGIAMVVAGQFPLSFEGSVRLVEVLYDGLLWGTDPRCLIDDARRRLFSQFSSTHDWASLTAYLSLPRNFEQRLPNIRIGQAQRSVDAAMNHADELTGSGPKSNGVESEKRFEVARSRMSKAEKRLNGLVSSIPEQRALIYGLLASTEKRRAEVLHHASSLESSLEDGKSLIDESKTLLVKARDYYWDSYLIDRTHHWAVVQYLSLDQVITHPPNSTEVSDPAYHQKERDPKALWTLAQVQSLNDLYLDDLPRQRWAHGNLIELSLLSLLPDLKNSLTKGEARRRAEQHTRRLIEVAGWQSFEVYSTRRQVLRYLTWYRQITRPKYFEPLVKLAADIFELFPSEFEQGRWRQP
jgi:CHAT domain